MERGEIEDLQREGRAIQKRPVKFHQSKNASSNKAKVFAKLVMEEKINSALRYLTDSDGGGVSPLTDDVMKQLQDKHPKAQPAALGSLLFGPVEDVHESVYSDMLRVLCLRVSRTPRRRQFANIRNNDLELENGLAGLN